MVFDPQHAALAPEVWNAAQHVMQVLLARPDLDGNALVSEARRVERLTLSDAHALVALATWADRHAGPASTDVERATMREAWMALEHAVHTAPSVTASADSSYAPPQHGWTPPPIPPPSIPPPVAPSPPAAASETPRIADHPSSLSGGIARTRRPTRATLIIVAGVVVLAILVAVAWYLRPGPGNSRAYDDGVAAYTRGAREVARTAFARAAQDKPDDPRPLIFLGRISREDGEIPRARRFLEAAVRLAPKSALASREMGSALLADGQPELARRFYVRALQNDPTDRAAQGFLSCALFRLQRYDESRRWSERAGPGDWSPCVTPPPLFSPGALPPGVPSPR